MRISDWSSDVCSSDLAPADFEGTMQQVIISLGAGAVRQVVGSNDLETVLAFSPDRLIKAVHDGELEAESILKSTLQIDGRMGRLQAEGQPHYSTVDVEQMAHTVVIGETRLSMPLDPPKL